MSIRTAFAAITVFVIVISAIPAVSGQFMTLQYPPDRTVREFGLLSISLSLEEEFPGQIEVSVNNVPAETLTPGGKFACLTVSIKPGVNTVKIDAIKDGRTLQSISFTAFRRSDLSAKNMTPPPDYKVDRFHTGDRKECSECHAMVPNDSDKKPVKIGEPVIPDATGSGKPSSTCYSCHRAIMSYPYVHGPASVWSCLSCHQTDSGVMYSVKKPDTELCFSCHVEQKKEWQSKKYIHGPVNIGKCAICHSPHASDYPFNLFMPTWDLCVNCHADKGTGRHVIGDSFSTEGHPTRDRPDPVRPGKELTCASCHNPHASNSPHLWAFAVQSLFDLCQKCHNK